MKIDELYTNLLEEALEEDTRCINSHAYWMADILMRLPNDPAFKKLSSSAKEEINSLLTAIE